MQRLKCRQCCERGPEPGSRGLHGCAGPDNRQLIPRIIFWVKGSWNKADLHLLVLLPSNSEGFFLLYLSR